MSELTKEKIYKKELEKVGGEGNNNLERIRSLAGGGGGATLYQHHIEIYDGEENETACVMLNIVSANNTAFTLETLGEYIYNCGPGDDDYKYISATGYWIGEGNTYYTIFGLRDSMRPLYFPPAIFPKDLTIINDTVTEIE